MDAAVASALWPQRPRPRSTTTTSSFWTAAVLRQCPPRRRRGRPVCRRHRSRSAPEVQQDPDRSRPPGQDVPFRKAPRPMRSKAGGTPSTSGDVVVMLKPGYLEYGRTGHQPRQPVRLRHPRPLPHHGARRPPRRDPTPGQKSATSPPPFRPSSGFPRPSGCTGKPMPALIRLTLWTASTHRVERGQTGTSSPIHRPIPLQAPTALMPARVATRPL